MADEKTFTARFKVADDGSIVLDKISGKLTDMGKRAEESLGGISRSLSLIKVDAIVNLAERAYQMGQRIYESGRQIASFGNEIDRMSKVAGLSSDTFQKFQYAAKLSDVSSEELAIGMKRLSANMSEAAQGQGKANEAFTAMGIKVTDTAGKLKPFDQMLMEIAGKFSQWEDGPNKIALALAIFGRSGEALVPMLNKGKSGIQDLMDNAEKLNTILGKDTIKALSDAEESYKKWEITWKISKAETFAPMLTIFTNILDRIREMKTAFKEGGFTGLFKDITRAQQEAQVMAQTAPDWVKKWVEEYQPAAKKPTAAPAMVPIKYAGPESKDVLSAWEAVVQKNEELYQIYAANNEQLYLSTDKLRELEIDMARVVAEAENLSEAGKLPDWRESLEELPKGFALIEGHLYEIKDLYDAITIDSAAWVKDWVKNSYKMNDAMKTTEDIAASIGNTLVSALGNAAHGFTNFADTVKNLGLQILSMIEQMILKMLFFGSITGEKNKETGVYGGLVGLVTKVIGSFQTGTSYVPQTGFAFVHKGEAIIPAEENMGRGGGGGIYIGTYIGNIEATDVDSFEKKYGPSVNKIQKASARRGGAARKTMKAYW